MSFDTKSTEDLIEIASAGVSFSLDATSRPIYDLIAILDAARLNGAAITVRNTSNLPQNELQIISTLNSANISFSS